MPRLRPLQLHVSAQLVSRPDWPPQFLNGLRAISLHFLAFGTLRFGGERADCGWRISIDRDTCESGFGLVSRLVRTVRRPSFFLGAGVDKEANWSSSSWEDGHGCWSSLILIAR